MVHVHGLGLPPAAINDAFWGRREVRALTGDDWVPVHVLDDGTVIQGSGKIIAWAQEHPDRRAGR